MTQVSFLSLITWQSYRYINWIKSTFVYEKKLLLTVKLPHTGLLIVDTMYLIVVQIKLLGGVLTSSKTMKRLYCGTLFYVYSCDNIWTTAMWYNHTFVDVWMLREKTVTFGTQVSFQTMNSPLLHYYSAWPVHQCPLLVHVWGWSEGLTRYHHVIKPCMWTVKVWVWRRKLAHCDSWVLCDYWQT